MKIRGTLETGEYAITATRAHGVRLLGPLLQALGAMAAWSFASSLGAGLPWLRFPALALALWLAFLAVRGASRWWLTAYILTTHRLVVRRGWAAARDVSIPLQFIEGAQVKRMVFLGAVNAAQMVVRSRGESHVLTAVPEASRFSQQLREAQQNFLYRR